MSREAELYKDKIEVSLDGRQIFYLLMVGRRVEARGHTDRAHVAATVDPLAALDRLEGGSGLSFQGALRGAEPPVSDVEKTIAAMPQVKAPGPRAPGLGQKEEIKIEAKKPELKKEEPKPEPKKEEAKPEVKKEEPRPEAKKDEAKKPDAKKDEVKAEVKKEEPKPDVKKDEPKKAEAKKEEPKSKFTLQLSSFQDKSEAQAYLDSIKAAGYQAYVTEGAVDGKQYFRVRLGSYRSIEAANEAKADFEKTARKSAVVMKL
jgi:cell division septation protein DedD